MNLESMPLDTPANVRAAWAMVNSGMVSIAERLGWLLPGKVHEARDRVWLAAVSHGLLEEDGETWKSPLR